MRLMRDADTAFPVPRLVAFARPSAPRGGHE